MDESLSGILSDINQDIRIARNAADIDFCSDLAAGDGRSIESCMIQIEKLQVELGRQRLLSIALIQFLIQQQLIDADQLQAFVNEIDAEDGVVDGQSPPDSPAEEEPEINPIAQKMKSPFPNG